MKTTNKSVIALPSHKHDLQSAIGGAPGYSLQPTIGYAIEDPESITHPSSASVIACNSEPYT